MRMARGYVWLSIVDLLAFIGFWAVTTVKRYAHQALSANLEVGYWVFAVLGLLLAAYGFYVLTRSRGTQVYRPVVCVLLAMSPACGALIGILSHLGTGPVGQ